MIKIIAGGKKHTAWTAEAIYEYEKRLRKPYELEWRFMDEEKLKKFLEKWPFSKDEYVILCDERGENISSPEFSKKLSQPLSAGKEIIILIGGAYGFSEDNRKNADFVWGFSKLVFPHLIARLIVTEQIYRATQIAIDGPYHHE